MPNIKRAMISSTALDLAEHRRAVMDACLSLDILPAMMEYLPASDADAVNISLRMVDEADLYIGIFAYRYGYIPPGAAASITEMEYNRALERQIPRLIFIIADEHPPLPREEGEAGIRLEALKNRLKTERVVKFFRNPSHLNAEVTRSLLPYSGLKQAHPSGESRNFSEQLVKTNALIKQLTDEQYQILDLLRYQKRVAIAGCAGSGKTLIAIEKALRSDAAGMRTLILCHSYYLAAHIQRTVQGTGVRVYDFTTWVGLLRGQDISTDNWMHYIEPTDHDLSEAFDALVDSQERYETVIVDEGQDFRELWWTLIEAALSSPEFSQLYIFHDDNQALLPSRARYPILPAPFVLSRNCRNGGAVFDIVRRLHPQSPETSLPLRDVGEVEQWVFYEESDLPERQFETKFRQGFMAALEKIPTEKMIILTSEPDESSRLEGYTLAETPPWSWQWLVGGVIKDVPLSDAPFPTPDDQKAVTRAALAAYPKNWTSTPEATRRINKIRPYLDQERKVLFFARNLTPGMEIAFFACDDWADYLPSVRQYVISSQPPTDSTTAEWVRLSTVSAFKGLESDGVLLFMPYPFQGTKNELEATVYVGISRARYLLYMVLEKRISARLPHLMLPYGHSNRAHSGE